MPATFETLQRIRSELAASGFPRGLAWWNAQFGRYHAAGAKRFAGRVGRGGAKSTSIVDEAINQTVFGDWHIPPGEVHYFAWVSQNKSEAGQRTRQIAARLRALGIPFDQSGDEIILRDLPRGFRVFACQVGAVSGFRCFGFCADELAKWTNASDSANPAGEVVASLRAMTVTHPNAREYFISSPLGKSGLHFEIIEAGDTDEQIVCQAPSWVANDSITEADTIKLEPDRRIWAREYAAVPQDARLAAFAFELIERGYAPRGVEMPAVQKVLILDPSSGGLSSRDRFTWAVASWHHDTFPADEGYLWKMNGEPLTFADGTRVRAPGYRNWKERGGPYLRLSEVGAIEGGFSGTLTGDQIADHLAAIARRNSIKIVHSDQRESLFLGAAMQKRGLRFHSHTWTSPSKASAVTLVRRWLADGVLSLPVAATELKRELLAFEEVVTASGSLTFGARGSAHDDYVALLVTLAHAELNPETRLPRSSLGTKRTYANY